MYCKNCGKKLDDDAKFCPSCGTSVTEQAPPEPEPAVNQNQSSICCPKCGSRNIDMQVHQEQKGGATIAKTKSKYKQKGHGCLWWLLIGWWWWMVDLMLWICIFPVRLFIQLFKKKKYVGDSTTVSATTNKIKYKTICLCKSCGYHWEN